MDIRDAGWKCAAVDVNLFPAGFNNLSLENQKLASLRFTEYLQSRLHVPPPWTLCVVPEAHTNNKGYLTNLADLIKILEGAGCVVKLLWPGPPIPKPWTVKSPLGTDLVYLPAEQALSSAQALILNHDLTAGIPSAISGVKLPTFPSTNLGWYKRRKSHHFEIVDGILRKLESLVDGFDPWYFSCRTVKFEAPDFQNDGEIEKLLSRIEEFVALLSQSRVARGIHESPRTFLKNDAGTYGLGVLSISGIDEIRRNRNILQNALSRGRGSQKIDHLILQEAIPTAYSYRKDGVLVVAEPTVYVVNGSPVGAFMRIHEQMGEDGAYQNLNQPGSLFESLDRASSRPLPLIRNSLAKQHLAKGQIYEFLATIHSIAAGMEDCPA
jgi:glutamate--cysteine ligase